MRKKILLMADVKSWAWGIKSRYIKKYLDDEFDIEIRYLDDGDPVPKEDRHDLYLTFCTNHLTHIERFPMGKRLTGVTSLVAYNRAREINFKDKCVAFHTNNVELYNFAKGRQHNRVYCLPNGVDTDLFKPKYRKPQPNKFVVGYVGKPIARKGYQGFVIPSAKAAGVTLATKIDSWKNATAHEKMPEFYDNIDVYLVAADGEGTPNGALEAAACGKPIISTPVGNMPEFVKDGVNGYLIKRELNYFIDRIKRLKNDPHKCLEMGRNARKTAEQWDWKIQVENYRKMFRELTQ